MYVDKANVIWWNILVILGGILLFTLFLWYNYRASLKGGDDNDR